MMDPNRQVLHDMGIDVWLLRDNNEAAAASLPESDDQNANRSDVPVSQPAPNDALWQNLQSSVKNCQACSLSKGRTSTVFGSGSPAADLLLIGDAPGAEDDRQGQPFMGNAGKLLNAMLYAIGLQREQVYITNVLKCRLTDKRIPQSAEVESCAAYLSAQIDYIQPKVILALGSIAAQSLLKIEAPVYKMRESENVLPGTNIPLVVTYHPASLLRSPEQKALCWQDLCKVRQLIQTHAGA